MNKIDFSILKKNNGFTLVELMVTIGVIAILAAIAIPTASSYRKYAYRMECQISIVNFLRAQDIYFLEKNCYYPMDLNEPGERDIKIAWGSNDPCPDDPEKYRFPELGVEFKVDSHRRYKITYEYEDGEIFKKEFKIELKTDEDFDDDGNGDYYSYKMINWQMDDDTGTNGQWDIYNNFWFEINGVPAFSEVLPSDS